MKAKSTEMLVFKDALRCRASLRTAELHPSWTVCNLDVSPISGYERIHVYFFGMTLHAHCTFHVCSLGEAATRWSFNGPARIERF